MGCCLSRLISNCGTGKILMLGLDGSGKSTIFHNLTNPSIKGEVTPLIPTIGFNVGTLEWNNLTMNLWDAGGKDRIRPLWPHYFQNTRAIIFVIDSTDTQRMGNISKVRAKLFVYGYIHNMQREFDMLIPLALYDIFHEYYHDPVLSESTAKYELHQLLEAVELQRCPYLILANKQECDDALSVDEIESMMELDRFKDENEYLEFAFFGCYGQKLEGVDKGLDWLIDTLKNQWS